MALTAAERETTMTIDDETRTWVIHSHRRADITRLKKNPDLVVLNEGTFEGSPYLHATLPQGGVALRTKSAGSIKRTGTRTRPDAATCKGVKTNGETCGSIAGPNGYCGRHKAQAK